MVDGAENIGNQANLPNAPQALRAGVEPIDRIGTARAISGRLRGPRAGARLVMGMVGTALVAILLSIAYQHHSARRAIHFWTPPLAKLIGQSTQVRLLALGDRIRELDETSDSAQGASQESQANDPFPRQERQTPSDQEIVTLGTARFVVFRELPGDKVRGLVHLRRGLLFDRVLADEPSQPTHIDRDWRFVLEFAGGGEKALVFFSADGEYVANAVAGQEIRVVAGERFLTVLEDALHPTPTK